MKIEQWSPRMLREIAYKQAITNIIDRFVLELPGLDLNNPYDLVSTLNHFAATDLFQELSYAAASRMVTGLLSDSARTWQEAAQESMSGRAIYRSLIQELKGPVGYTVQSLIDRNAKLISALPEDMVGQVNTFIKNEAYKGRRSSSIAKDLIEQFPDVAQSRINLIARTETSKASTALTRARSNEMGLDWFLWITSKDARVRRSHAHMDGVLINWAELPSPESLNQEKRTYGHYAPGDIFNCRCYPAPLIRIDSIAWPHKVYINGSIQMMTRHHFELNTGGRRKAA
jgi:SPP1 gp7 family putative phage head morphogenesis protein